MMIFASGLKLNLNLTLSPRDPPADGLEISLALNALCVDCGAINVNQQIDWGVKSTAKLNIPYVEHKNVF